MTEAHDDNDRAIRELDERGQVPVSPMVIAMVRDFIGRLEGSGIASDLDAKRLLARLGVGRV